MSRRFIPILVLAVLVSTAVARQAVSPEQLFEEAVRAEVALGDLETAITLYTEVEERSSENRSLAADALVRLGRVYEKLGRVEARTFYDRLLTEYADQASQAAEARSRLALVASPDQAPADRDLVARRVRVEGDAFTGPYGALSPDGRFLSVIDGPGLFLGLYDLQSGTVRRLPMPSYSGYVVYSMFSPDGTMVAYNHGTDLRVVDSDGSNDRFLYDASTSGGLPVVKAWSPDGSWLLVLFDDRIGRVSFPEGDVEMIRTFDWRTSTRLSISPDGRYLAYDFAPDEDRPNARDIFVMPTDWSREISVVESPSDDSSPVWTPDGKSIVFVSDRAGSNDLWVQPVQEGGPVGAPSLVKSEGGEVNLLGFTRDGDLYYRVFKATSEIHFASLDAGETRLSSIDMPPVESPGIVFSQPTWSPDGQRWAYVAQDGSDEWTARLVVEDIEPRTRSAFPMSHLSYFWVSGWSPDGDRILVSGRRRTGGHESLWLDVRSGNEETVMTAPSMLLEFTLSPDGTTVYYKYPEWPLPTVARDLATGTERTLIADSSFGSIRRSPDGTRLAVESTGPDGRRVLVADLTRGGTHMVDVPRPESATDIPLAWARGGQTLLVVIDGELWRVPMDGGEPDLVRQELGELRLGPGPGVTRGRTIEVHPDGKTLAFMDSSTAREIWVLEELRVRP